MVGNVVEVPTHAEINEKIRQSHAIDRDDAGGAEISKEGVRALDADITAVPPYEDGSENDKDNSDDDNAIIITGADAALHLLPMRDDGDPSLTFRSILLATGLSGFQAVMNQIYQVRD